MLRSTSAILVSLFTAAAVASAQTKETAEPVRQEAGPLLALDLPGSRKLTVSSELRWRGEHRENYDFDDSVGANPTFVDQRARLSIGLTVNDQLSSFLQLQDARTFGEETSTLDRSADGLDLHQAYLDWKITCCCLDGELRLGRQELALGDQRLISSLNWATQARSFDGAVFRSTPVEDFHAILFGLVTRQDKLATDNQGQYLGGVWLGGAKPDKSLEGDVYLIALFDSESAPDGVSHLYTVGARARGKWQGFDGGFEAAFQYGEVNRADVPFGEVYGIHVDAGYAPPDCPWSPRVGVEYNVATGNDPNTPDNERFNSLFPFAHAYFGYMDFALWENLGHFAVHLTAHPGDTKVRFAWHNFHADESGDRFSGPTNVLSSGVGGRSHMGDELDLTCRHPLAERVWGEAGAGVFFPGGGVSDAQGTADTAVFLYYMMGVKL